MTGCWYIAFRTRCGRNMAKHTGSTSVSREMDSGVEGEEWVEAGVGAGAAKAEGEAEGAAGAVMPVAGAGAKVGAGAVTYLGAAVASLLRAEATRVPYEWARMDTDVMPWWGAGGAPSGPPQRDPCKGLW